MGRWLRCTMCYHIHNAADACGAVTALGPCGCKAPCEERTFNPAWTTSSVPSSLSPSPSKPLTTIIPASHEEIESLRRQLPGLLASLAELKALLDEVTEVQKDAQRKYNEIEKIIQAYRRGIDSITTRAVPTSELDL